MFKYKILNKLFGWDYIQWRNSADCGIARVLVDGDGCVYYWRYKSSKLADIIPNKSAVLWLTCSPSKYFSTKLFEARSP